MKPLLILLVLLNCELSFSQDTTVTWIRRIDTTSFKMLYNKKDIPKEFYGFLYIKDLNKFANPNDDYTPACVNPIRGQLHWIAKQKDKWVICITYGGRVVFTRLCFFDKETGDLNFNEMNFPLPKQSDVTFGQIVESIKSGEYGFEEFDPEDYKLEED